jgi:hypothetical protein
MKRAQSAVYEYRGGWMHRARWAPVWSVWAGFLQPDIQRWGLLLYDIQRGHHIRGREEKGGRSKSSDFSNGADISVPGHFAVKRVQLHRPLRHGASISTWSCNFKIAKPQENAFHLWLTQCAVAALRTLFHIFNSIPRNNFWTNWRIFI